MHWADTEPVQIHSAVSGIPAQRVNLLTLRPLSMVIPQTQEWIQHPDKTNADLRDMQSPVGGATPRS
eukprot:8086793-Alexandrium_andersonii.AAC.1